MQRGRLLDDILDDPKTGFGVPYEEWLRTSFFKFSRENLLDSRFINRFALDAPAVERMLNQHRNRMDERGFMLLKLLQLSLWNLNTKSTNKAI